MFMIGWNVFLIQRDDALYKSYYRQQAMENIKKAPSAEIRWLSQLVSLHTWCWLLWYHWLCYTISRLSDQKMSENLTPEEKRIVFNAVRYYQIHKTSVNGTDYQICDNILNRWFNDVKVKWYCIVLTQHNQQFSYRAFHNHVWRVIALLLHSRCSYGFLLLHFSNDN